MALVPYPNFCGPAYQFVPANPRVVLSVDQCINCYVQKNEIGTGKAGVGLIVRPGYSLFSSPATPGNGRVLWAGEQRLFGIAGSKFVEIAVTTGAQTVLGDIGSGSGVCTITSNGNQQLIINPNTTDVYYDDGTLNLAATPTGARMGFQLRGYGYIVSTDTNTLFQSDPDDFSVWDSLKQATAKISTDRIVAVIESGGYAWLVGSATAQMWAFVGTAGFALEPVQSAFVTEGTCAPYSLATANSRVCWVTGSRRGYGRVVAVSPGRVDRISNYAVEKSLRGVSDWGTVVGSGYSSDGHDFYELDVPDLSLTWVYDFQEAAWHQRRGWSGSAYTRMLGRQVQCTFNNTYYVISPIDGKVYKQDDNAGDDLGVVFRSQRTGPILASGKLTSFNAFRLDMQTGDGSSVVGANARFSFDGGKTYGAYSYEIMGRNGEENVLEWAQLGDAGIRGFVADVYFDQGPFAVAGAWVDPSPGLS